MMRRERENRIKKGIWREIINSDGPLKNHLETYDCRIIYIYIYNESLCIGRTTQLIYFLCYQVKLSVPIGSSYFLLSHCPKQ